MSKTNDDRYPWTEHPYASLATIRATNSVIAKPIPDWELIWTVYREAACRIGGFKRVNAVPGGLEAVANAAYAAGVAAGLRMASEAALRRRHLFTGDEEVEVVSRSILSGHANWCEAKAQDMEK